MIPRLAPRGCSIPDSRPSRRIEHGVSHVRICSATGVPPAEVNRLVREHNNDIPEASGKIPYALYAFDAPTGTLLWEREVHKGLRFSGRHRRGILHSSRNTAPIWKHAARGGDIGR